MDKQKLLETVKNILIEKITHFENLIAELRASNNDTKSSMGDKYETSREMLQQEINQLLTQCNNYKKQLETVQNISVQKSDKVGLGALVKTEAGWFYIITSLGEITIDGNKIRPISAESPLALAMNGKKQNETFLLNKNQQTILEVL